MLTLRYCVALCVAVACATPALAQDSGQAKVLFNHAIPNIAGKSMVVVEVNYAPGAKSAPHRHSASAFIYAYVVSGAIRSQIEGETAHVYDAGEGFSERPGQHHLVSENASHTKSAKLLAIFVVDTDDKPLTQAD